MSMLHFATIATAITTTICGQDLAARKKASLEKDFLAYAPWVSNFAAAKADARASGRLIFGFFSRSYAP